MPGNNDPFGEYYRETLRPEDKKETMAEMLARLENDSEEARAERARKADADLIRVPISVYIKKMNALIGEFFTAERANGRRDDLIITLLVGGLAFTVANVFYLISRNLGSKMTAEEYEAEFLRMYRSAVSTIGKGKK